MKLTIEGTTDEIQKVLQAIAGSEEHLDRKKLYKSIGNLTSGNKKPLKAEMANSIKLEGRKPKMKEAVDPWKYRQEEWFNDGVKAVKKALFQQPSLTYEQADYVLSQVHSDLADEKEQNII